MLTAWPMLPGDALPVHIPELRQSLRSGFTLQSTHL